MSEASQVELEVDAGVARLWLNRPHVRNALDRQTIADFAAHVEALERRDDVRVAVLAGRGEAFCSGADLHEIGRLAPAEAKALERQCAEVFDRWATLPIPLVASVHGYAVGGGFLITLFCDVRIVAADARIGLPPVARNWLPPWGLSRLAAWVGPARAEQLLLMAGLLDAQEARHIGLADRVVPPERLLQATDELAQHLAGSRREVVAEVRSFFGQLRGRPHADWDREASRVFERLFATPEAQGALAAFARRGAARGESVTDEEDGR